GLSSAAVVAGSSRPAAATESRVFTHGFHKTSPCFTYALIARIGRVQIPAKAVCQHQPAAWVAWSRRLQPTCLRAPLRGLPEKRGYRPYTARFAPLPCPRFVRVR